MAFRLLFTLHHLNLRTRVECDIKKEIFRHFNPRTRAECDLYKFIINSLYGSLIHTLTQSATATFCSLITVIYKMLQHIKTFLNSLLFYPSGPEIIMFGLNSYIRNRQQIILITTGSINSILEPHINRFKYCSTVNVGEK